jgi:hypothetical protein
MTLRLDTDKIVREVQENYRRLGGCAQHVFEKIEPWQPLRGRWRCRNCQGEIDNHAHTWFAIGKRMVSR